MIRMGDQTGPPQATARFTVTAEDTAAALGSGTVEVLGTPRLLAWCEAVTCTALAPLLDAGSTSVGTRVELEHRGACGVGAAVEIRAEGVYADGRLHRLSVLARLVDPDTQRPGAVLGTGEITRVIVDAERFLARLDR